MLVKTELKPIELEARSHETTAEKDPKNPETEKISNHKCFQNHKKIDGVGSANNRPSTN